MPESPSAPATCAQCGATIPPRARACPECGADERTGWRESSIYDGLDLPDAAWTDDSTSDSHGRNPVARRVNGVAWYWWCVGAALLALLVFGVIGLR